MKLSFLSLASGSSGNYYYLGISEFGMLIDVGIGIRTIEKALKNRSIGFTKIVAVLITYDHADYIRTVGYLGEKLCIPVYAITDVHRGIDENRYAEETLYISRRAIGKEVSFFIRSSRIAVFKISHDSTDSVGYHIEYGNHKFTLATDIGHITDTVGKYICMANHLILEANYDEGIFRFGTYPTFLKERVASPTGRLSGRKTAEFLVTHYNIGLESVWPCHFSRDNSYPKLVYKTVDICLFQEDIRVGKDVPLVALKWITPLDIYEFD